MNKESTKEQITEEIIEGVKNLYSSEKWKSFLDFSSKFNTQAHRYSFNNQLMIMMQNPDSTYVASYSAFKKMGITVNRGESGMWICCADRGTRSVLYDSIKGTPNDTEKVRETLYVDKDGNERVKIPQTYFNYRRCVFDISQTDGADKINKIAPKLNQNLDSGRYEKLLDVLKETTTATIKFKPKDKDFILLSGASGYFRPSENLIVVNEDMSEADKIKTLVHEIAHSNLHGEELKVQGIEDTSILEGKDMKEIQAESVAYVVCKQLGIDSSTRSFDYIGLYAYKEGTEDKENKAIAKVKENLSVVIECSNQMLDVIEKELGKDIDIKKDIPDEKEIETPENELEI